MYLVDTNIFLELFLEQQYSDICKKFLMMIRDGKIFAFVTDFTLHSIGVILSNYKKVDMLEEVFIDLKKFIGLNILNTDIKFEIEAIKIMRKFNLDFDDAIQYKAAKDNSIKIVSFDNDFDKTDIKRITKIELEKIVADSRK